MAGPDVPGQGLVQRRRVHEVEGDVGEVALPDVRGVRARVTGSHDAGFAARTAGRD